MQVDNTYTHNINFIPYMAKNDTSLLQEYLYRSMNYWNNQICVACN